MAIGYQGPCFAWRWGLNEKEYQISYNSTDSCLDINPNNILVSGADTPTPTVKIADLGGG